MFVAPSTTTSSQPPQPASGAIPAAFSRLPSCRWQSCGVGCEVTTGAWPGFYVEGMALHTVSGEPHDAELYVQGMTNHPDDTPYILHAVVRARDLLPVALVRTTKACDVTKMGFGTSRGILVYELNPPHERPVGEPGDGRRRYAAAVQE